MPIYEFKCEDCNEQFEILIEIKKVDSIICINCGGHILRRLLSSGSLVFKGPGFYETDYKKKEKKGKKKKEKKNEKS